MLHYDDINQEEKYNKSGTCNDTSQCHATTNEANKLTKPKCR